METDLKRGFYLGDWDVRPLRGLAVGPGGEKRVEPRVMDVLLVLAEQAGEVVERDALLERVWGGRAMSDEPLNRCISQLRSALGDSRQEPRFIETVPRRGYRLIAPVRPLAAAEPAAAAAAPEPPTARPATRLSMPLLAVAAVALVAVGAAVMKFGGFPPATGGATPDAASIAVLPFDNLSDDPAQDDLGRGLAEEVRQRLASVDGLTVAARTSSSAFEGKAEDATTIAARLGVRHLVEGSIRVDGDRIRISAYLVHSDGYEIWNNTYDADLAGVFAMQDDVANDIVTQIGPAIFGGADGRTPIRTAESTQSSDAYLLRVRAAEQLGHRSEGPLRRAIALFEEAIGLDPSYGEAYVGLATAHALLPFYSEEPMDASFDLARSIIATGARVDPTVDTKAAGIVAFMLFQSQWRWIESENAFRVALQNNRNDAELLNWYSVFLASVGDSGGSLEFALRARDLDRLSPVVNQRLAVAYLWMNDDELADKQFALAAQQGIPVQTQPEAYLVLLLRQGKLDLARFLMEGLQRARGRDSAWVDALFDALRDPANRPRAVAVVERAARDGDISDLHRFGAWVYLDETERAIDTALSLTQERIEFIPEFLFAAETAGLRRHPRFAEIVRSMKLDRYWDYFGWPDLCRRQGDDIACD